MSTHYDLLGVRSDATEDQIRTAFRTLARLHHPDTAARPSVADADASDVTRPTMAALNTAWAVLGDPTTRRAYDTSIGLGDEACRPRPDPDADRQWAAHDHVGGEEEFDGSGGPGAFGFDDPDAMARPRRPSDLLVMAPVLLLASALALFFASLISGSAAMRTLGLLMVPVSGVGFLTAPLFAMIRSRSRPGP